nr:hypothetical protein Iba_chr08fCG2480 [Ipomoea batatas]
MERKGGIETSDREDEPKDGFKETVLVEERRRNQEIAWREGVCYPKKKEEESLFEANGCGVLGGVKEFFHSTFSLSGNTWFFSFLVDVVDPRKELGRCPMRDPVTVHRDLEKTAMTRSVAGSRLPLASSLRLAWFWVDDGKLWHCSEGGLVKGGLASFAKLCCALLSASGGTTALVVVSPSHPFAFSSP